MSTEETPTTTVPQTWGTPPPLGAGTIEVPTQVEVRPHWSARKVIGAVVLAVVIVGGGTAVAIAATQPTAASATHANAGVSGGQVTSGGGSGRHGGGYSGGPFANAVHGDFVARTSSGGFVTERFQTGTVTKLGTTSITVTSQDHYVGHYLINGSTVLNHGSIALSDIQVDDTVTVIATVSGSTATATTVSDPSRQQPPATRSDHNSGGMQPNDTTTPASPGS